MSKLGISSIENSLDQPLGNAKESVKIIRQKGQDFLFIFKIFLFYDLDLLV